MNDAPSAIADVPTVRLHDDAGLDWQPVSDRLIAVRRLTLLIWLALPLIVTAVLSVVVTPWIWSGFAVFAALLAWLWWLIPRQVRAMSWIELPEELVVRRGRLQRSLSSVPYGRMQYVDVQSGPFMRWKGLATVEIHTASPATSGAIPGLPRELAEDLRTRLAARGESLRAGL